MRKYLLAILAVVFMAACSTPKYTYYFDHYDYNAGKKKKVEHQEDVQQAEVISDLMIKEPLKLDEAALVTSNDGRPVLTAEGKAKVEEAAKAYREMSKAEKREFRKEAKQLIKTYIKAKRAGDDVKAAEAAKAMDHDLKLAAIFGAVGIVALLIGGDVFWILGGIALIIGVVFFVMWLSRQ